MIEVKKKHASLINIQKSLNTKKIALPEELEKALDVDNHPNRLEGKQSKDRRNLLSDLILRDKTAFDRAPQIAITSIIRILVNRSLKDSRRFDLTGISVFETRKHKLAGCFSKRKN